MSDYNLTENQIIKSLENCRNNEREHTCKYCEGCPAGDCEYNDDRIGDCIDLLNTAALDLIKRLKEKNTWLRGRVNLLEKYDEERDIALHARIIADARSAAFKEFAEALEISLLKQLTYSTLEKQEIIYFCLDEISNFLKEKTEGEQ